MANHKSALKRHRQSLDRRSRNRANKSLLRTAIRKVSDAMEAGDADTAKSTFQQAVPVIHRIASKGTIHKNTASRKVSRLALRLNKMLQAG